MTKFKRVAIYGAKNKGGIGLSTALLAITTILRATGGEKFDVIALDADGFNHTLTQRLGQRDSTGKLLADQDPMIGVGHADLLMRDGAAPIFEAVESDARVVVVDTPAGGLKQSQPLTENLSARDLVQHCLDHQRTPIVLVPFGPALASIRGVGEAIETFGPDAHIVAVRSSVGVEERDYRLWETDGFTDQFGRRVGGNTRKAFETSGGRLIMAPALAAGANAMAEAMGLTYAQAVTFKGDGWQSVDRLNTRQWLYSWVTQLQTIAGLLDMENVDWKVC